ncbi:MAG: Uma2 family endonuclease [Myxococcota bacterium]
MEQARKRATYADLLALPEDVRAEVIGGVVEATPSPLPMHSRAQGALARSIGGPFDEDHGRGGPGGWWILAEVDVRLAEHDIVRPDVAGWKRERLPAPWDVRPIDVVPDWICEIVSPSNAAHDRVTKANLYARYAVPFYWLVDPAERVLEAFRLADGIWLRTGSYDDRAMARVPPFEQVELEVGLLFPPQPEPDPSTKR